MKIHSIPVRSLTTAIAVTSIGGAAALAVTLPDPAHPTTGQHRAGYGHGHAGHLTRPHAPPVPSARPTPHATSSAS
jgi:hypothetical protein